MRTSCVPRFGTEHAACCCRGCHLNTTNTVSNFAPVVVCLFSRATRLYHFSFTIPHMRTHRLDTRTIVSYDRISRNGKYWFSTIVILLFSIFVFSIPCYLLLNTTPFGPALSFNCRHSPFIILRPLDRGASIQGTPSLWYLPQTIFAR